MNKKILHDLKTFLKRHVKWFDDTFPNDQPKEDTLDQVYTWLPHDVKLELTCKRFKHLFKLRLEHYRETKG